MTTTQIEWTDVVWNPTTGCDQVSAGCDHCYALTMAKRLNKMGAAKYQTDGDPRTSGPGFGLAMHADTLTAPLSWHKPRRVFVNSMSDLFHPKVTDRFLAQVFAVMAATPQHTYQILTKRAPRMAAFLTDECRCDNGHAPGVHLRSAMEAAATPHLPSYVPGLTSGLYHRMQWPLPNVQVGVSVENQEQANARIPYLLMPPNAVPWLSLEPLLGPVDLTRVAWTGGGGTHLDVVHGRHGAPDAWTTEGKRIAWAVVGGESGPGARPMHPDWARSLRDQCAGAGVPFFFKQWGAFQDGSSGNRKADYVVVFDGRHELCTDHTTNGGDAKGPLAVARIRHEPGTHSAVIMSRVGKNRAGRELDGRTWDQMPEVTRDASPEPFPVSELDEEESING
jgi:protein gp37